MGAAEVAKVANAAKEQLCSAKEKAEKMASLKIAEATKEHEITEKKLKEIKGRLANMQAATLKMVKEAAKTKQRLIRVESELEVANEIFEGEENAKNDVTKHLEDTNKVVEELRAQMKEETQEKNKMIEELKNIE